MCDLLVMYNPPCRVQKCKVLSLISVLMHAFVTFAKLNLLCTKITVFCQFAHFNKILISPGCFTPSPGLVLFSSSSISISLWSPPLFLFLLYPDWTLSLFIFFALPLSTNWAHVLTGEGHPFFAACQNGFPLKHILNLFWKAHKPCDYFALAQKTTDSSKMVTLMGSILSGLGLGTTKKTDQFVENN
jgi:hypothetical protein